MIKRHCLCSGLALVAEPAGCHYYGGQRQLDCGPAQTGCRLADFSVYFETGPSHFGRLLVVRAAAEYQVALR